MMVDVWRFNAGTTMAGSPDMIPIEKVLSWSAGL